MKNPIIMHINYCEQGQTLERIFKVATSIGYDGVEFRRFKDIYGLDQKAYLETIAELKDAFNLPLTFFGGPELDTVTEKAEESLEGYLKFLEIADGLHLLSTINMMTAKSVAPGIPADLYHCDDHGYAVKDDIVWERTVETCRKIADLYPHVHFAFETHMFYVHDTAKSARYLVDAIDRGNFGINLDYGNALYILFDNWQEISQMSRIDILKRHERDFIRIIHKDGWEKALKRKLDELKGQS